MNIGGGLHGGVGGVGSIHTQKLLSNDNNIKPKLQNGNTNKSNKSEMLWIVSMEHLSQHLERCAADGRCMLMMMMMFEKKKKKKVLHIQLYYLNTVFMKASRMKRHMVIVICIQHI